MVYLEERKSLEHTLRHYLLFHKLRDMKHRVKVEHLRVLCRT